MKTIPSLLKLQLLSASLLVLAAVPATAGSTGVTYPVSVGNNEIGSKATYGYTAQNSSTLASVSANATASGNIVGVTGNLVDFSTTSSLTSGKPAANLSFKVGNFTVFSQTVTTNVQWNDSVSETFLTASSTLPVTVGGVTYPVSLKGTLAGSGSVSLSATFNTAAKSVTLSGDMSDTVNGSATASLPTSSGAAAAVSSTSNLAIGTSTLTTNSTVSTTAMSGTTSLALGAYNLVFGIVITPLKPTTTASSAIIGTNIASYLAAARTITLLKL